LRETDGGVIAIAACDPANPFGSVLAWPRSDGRMARAAGAYCVLDGGRLVLYLERGGHSLLTNGDVSLDHLRALVGAALHGGRVELQRVDGVSVVDSPLAPLLREAGFSSTHRGLVAYAGRSGRAIGNGYDSGSDGE
jgi:ATP-dependent Lhr-like helicase